MIVTVPACIPVRSIIWFMIFTCVWFFYMMRVNLSIVILAMVEPSKNADNTTVVPECLKGSPDFINSSFSQTGNAAVPNYGERYPWDAKLQGMILGAYFYGFIIAGGPSGYLAERFGPRKCILISFTASAILTILGPWTASLHYWYLIVSRFLIGAIGGVVYPCMHYLIARYSPPDEKGKFVGALMGNSLGTVVTWPLLGAVIESLGWAWAFYICGIMVLAWLVFFMIFVYDSPEDHPLMCDSEKKYISESFTNVEKTIKNAPPYYEIAKSVPFWALMILHFGNLWGLFFLLTAGPNFMSTVLGFTLGHTGFIAALPYLARATFGFIFGMFGDYIIRRNLLSKTTIRKVFLLFSHFLPGILLAVETFVGCDVTWAIFLITMSLGMNGASTITNLQNSQDLSPNYAPTLYGIVNAVGSSTGIINPLIVGYITAENNGLAEWKKIFYVGSSVYIASAIVFAFFGTGETQPWNEITAKDEKRDMDEDSIEIKSNKIKSSI